MKAKIFSTNSVPVDKGKTVLEKEINDFLVDKHFVSATSFNVGSDLRSYGYLSVFYTEKEDE